MNTADALQTFNISPRQLGHWIDRGWVRVEQRGTGHPRHLNPTEAKILAVLVRLHRAGFTLDRAAEIARTLTTTQNEARHRGGPDDAHALLLAPGVAIFVNIPETTDDRT